MAGATNKSAKRMGYSKAQIQTERAKGGVLSHAALMASGAPAKPTKAYRALAEAMAARKAGLRKPGEGAPAGWQKAARGEGKSERDAATAARAALVQKRDGDFRTKAAAGIKAASAATALREAPKKAAALAEGKTPGAMRDIVRARMRAVDAVQTNVRIRSPLALKLAREELRTALAARNIVAQGARGAAKKKAADAAAPRATSFNAEKHLAKRRALVGKLDAIVSQRKQAFEKARDAIPGVAVGPSQDAYDAARRRRDKASKAYEAAKARPTVKAEKATGSYKQTLAKAAKADADGVVPMMRKGASAVRAATPQKGHGVVYDHASGSTSERKVASRKGAFFAYRSPTGGYSVAHSGSGIMISSFKGKATALKFMAGAAKSGSRVMDRVATGDARSLRALGKYAARHRAAE